MVKKRLTSKRVKRIKTGQLLLFPAKIGDPIYEVIVDDFPEWCCYVAEYELQDISVKGIKYADHWVEYGFPEVYLNREEAQRRCDTIRKEREQMLLGYGCKCCDHCDEHFTCMNPQSDEYGEWVDADHWCMGFTPYPEWKKRMLRQFNRRRE